MKKLYFIVGILAFLAMVFQVPPSLAQAPKDAKAPGTSAAVAAPPVKGQVGIDEATYIIGPEDILYIHVWREDQLTRTVPVRMDGKITLPLVNDVQAAGMTPLQLKESLTARFKDFFDSPDVSVVVMEANSYKVYVSGEVKTPGVYRLRTETTILEIVPMAGGFTEWADRGSIMIIRKEGGKEKRMEVDYKRIVKGKDPNIALKAGDVIVVP